MKNVWPRDVVEMARSFARDARLLASGGLRDVQYPPPKLKRVKPIQRSRRRKQA